MKTIDALQGSPEWLAARAKHFTASEAPAMMGASKYQTRTELLHQKHTGIAAEVDDAKQRLFDRGHAAEAAARPIVEAIIGEALYPVTGALEVDGLPLLASFDGLSLLEDKGWECKLFNAALADAVRAGHLEPHYYWQLEQQLLVSGAEAIYFTTTDGTPENTIGMWYESVPERRAALIAGWKQFAEDLASYVHVEKTVASVAAPIEALPALAVTVSGQISLTHNLDRFGKRLTEFVGSLNAKPETDQDFADLDAAVKVLKEAEAQLDAAESNALAQTPTIADMQNLVAMYRKVARDNRLMFEKIVKAEKENRRAEIVRSAADAMSAHYKAINERIGGNWMPAVNTAVIADSIKGLKSLDSMRDKVSVALAKAKIEANEVADRIWENRTSLQGETHDWIFLFPDFSHICTKATDDFAAILAMRLNQEDERQEAERERIRQEEADRITREAARADLQAKAQAAQDARDNDQRGKADAGSNASGEAADVGSIPQPVAASTPPIQDHFAGAGNMIDEAIIDDFIRLLPLGLVEKKALRPHLLAWERYRISVQMKDAV